MADPKENPQNLKFGSKLGVQTASEKEKKRRRNRALHWFLSILLFFFFFLQLTAFSFFTVYLNAPDTWVDYFVNNYHAIIFMEVCFFFLTTICFCYYAFECRKVLFSVKDTICILLVLDIGVIACYLTGRYIHIFARPVVLTSLLISFLRNKKEAVFLNIMQSMIVFIIDYFTNFYGLGMNFYIFTSFLLSFCCGLLAVFISGFVKTRIKMLLVGVFLSLPTALIIGTFWLAQGYQYTSYDFVEVLVYGVIAMIFSVLLFMSLLPIFELIFSSLTVFRLRELTSFDVKLLKRLREEAPATFDHSRIVAQFAEMCAADVGENAELARAAAYYHDVGKIAEPSYFTENQRGYNPHDYLPPEVSVEVIRAHTVNGKELIKKAHLPDFFGEVALRHHGTMPIRYFYMRAKTMADGESVSLKDYSYQDSKPLNKITAIIMLCDSCEAAIRSFRDNVTRQRQSGGEVSAEAVTNGIETIIKKIVDERVELDQFSECDITMKELGIISTSILNCATGVYHGRVAYPELNRRKKNR